VRQTSWPKANPCAKAPKSLSQNRSLLRLAEKPEAGVVGPKRPRRGISATPPPVWACRLGLELLAQPRDETGFRIGSYAAQEQSAMRDSTIFFDPRFQTGVCKKAWRRHCRRRVESISAKEALCF